MTLTIPDISGGAWVAIAFFVWYVMAFVAFRWGGWGKYTADNVHGSAEDKAQLTALAFVFSPLIVPCLVLINGLEWVGRLLFKENKST